MNRDFVYNSNSNRQEPTSWQRLQETLARWVWGAFCCGAPGAPCALCTCCEKREGAAGRDRPRIHQSTATAERVSRPRRPHTPGARKSTPEMVSAVRCALSQLQGEPAPILPDPPRELAVREPG